MNKKELIRQKRHRRMLMKIKLDESRPRLLLHRSIKNISCQIIDDVHKKTLFSMSTMDKEIREKFPSGGNVKASGFFGEVFARRAKEKGISKILFDRAGYLYHGRVKAFAEALRKGGLQF